jgi:hypothetical protein
MTHTIHPMTIEEFGEQRDMIERVKAMENGGDNE